MFFPQMLILRLENLRLLIEKDLRLARYARIVARELGSHRSGEGVGAGERLGGLDLGLCQISFGPSIKYL